MKKEVLKRIFEFLEDKENKNPPFIWKHENNLPLTKEELNVEGDLSLVRSNIESLPEGLKVGRDLDIFGSKITSLPKGLEVGRFLDIRDTKITSLPKGLELGSSLYIRHTALVKYSDEELQDMVKPGFINGRIHR